VERCSARAELGLTDSHGVEGHGIHDVEAAASIHQYFGKPCVANNKIDNKWVSTRLWDVIRVVIAVECDGRPRLVEEGWHGWVGGVDLSALQLALAPRVVGHGTTEDHEAIINNRKVVVLLLAIALVLLRPLAKIALPLGTSREVVFHHAAFLEGVFDRAPVVWARLLEHLVKNS
jgi:hypothetical protein